VKTPSLPFADGRFGLPAYHEWIGRFGEFLRIDAGQVIDKRRMSSGRSAIQPLIFVNDPQNATAYFRQTRASSEPKQIPVSQTQDAGQSWQQSGDLRIPNPNSAVTGIILNNGARLLALNDIEEGRYRLVLMMSDAKSGQWRTVHIAEDDEALPNERRREFSYPYLMSVDGNDAHLVYTWDRKKIRHLYFSEAWLAHAFSQLSSNEPEVGNNTNATEIQP
jgi:predicted neuraminidase